MSDTRHLFSLLILILLDDSVHNARKSDLLNFVSNTTAKDAMHLSSQVYIALCKLANGLATTSVLGAHAGLWQLKKKGDNEAD